MGSALVVPMDDGIELHDLVLEDEPPPPVPLTLVLALPRPKVLNRVVASLSSMGIKRIHLINSWRVDKSYWKSPKLDVANLRVQSVIGLEQGVDFRKEGLEEIDLTRIRLDVVDSLDGMLEYRRE